MVRPFSLRELLATIEVGLRRRVQRSEASLTFDVDVEHVPMCSADMAAVERILVNLVDDAPAQRGIGLGLAMSRDVARGVAGDLTCGDTLGGGATFRLRLPRSGRTPNFGAALSDSERNLMPQVSIAHRLARLGGTARCPVGV